MTFIIQFNNSSYYNGLSTLTSTGYYWNLCAYKDKCKKVTLKKARSLIKHHMAFSQQTLLSEIYIIKFIK